MSTISLIAALDERHVIGRGNRLQWRLPADLRRFRCITMGKPLLIGRRTFESIGRPLPGRTNIIITSDLRYRAPGCVVCHSVEQALHASGAADEVIVIGGAQLYKQTLPCAQRLYLTIIHACFAGDIYFPAYNLEQWHTIERQDHEADAHNPYAYSFLILDRPAPHPRGSAVDQQARRAMGQGILMRFLTPSKRNAVS
jgi:dihydrofolate reductase